jgi:hypothetical protein
MSEAALGLSTPATAEVARAWPVNSSSSSLSSVLSPSMGIGSRNELSAAASALTEELRSNGPPFG